VTTLERLVYMLNQIATNLASQSETPALAVADHVAMFWDPRMKSIIFKHLDEADSGLSPVSFAAMTHLRDQGAPPSQSRATEYQAGQSDAG